MTIRFGVIFISDSVNMDLVKLLPGIFYCENANTHKYH